MRSKKPICAPSRVSGVPLLLSLKLSNIGLIDDDGPCSSSQVRSLSASTFFASLFQVSSPNEKVNANRQVSFDNWRKHHLGIILSIYCFLIFIDIVRRRFYHLLTAHGPFCIQTTLKLTSKYKSLCTFHNFTLALCPFLKLMSN